MAGDQEIVAADRCPQSFQRGAYHAVRGVCGDVERQNVYLAQQLLHRLDQPPGSASCASIAQLGCHDDAGADVIFADLGDALRSLALWISDQVREDVRVQQVAGQNTSSRRGTGSTMSGKSSFTGFIDFSKATRPRLRSGSITSRSPSRCMIASLPGSSNST